MLLALQDTQQSHCIPFIIILYIMIGGDADVLIARTATSTLRQVSTVIGGEHTDVLAGAALSTRIYTDAGSLLPIRGKEEHTATSWRHPFPAAGFGHRSVPLTDVCSRNAWMRLLQYLMTRKRYGPRIMRLATSAQLSECQTYHQHQRLC